MSRKAGDLKVCSWCVDVGRTAQCRGCYTDLWLRQKRKTKTMKRIIIALSVVALVALTGCASLVLPSPKQLDALAKDPNSIRLKVQTMYGNMELERNMDRFAAPTNTSSGFIVTPETTLNVRRTK